jgi:hypothetical protein
MNPIVRICCLSALVYALLPPAPASALLDPLTVSPTAPRHQKPIDQRDLIVDVPPAERRAMLASIRVEDTTESLTIKSRNDFSHEIPDAAFEEIRVPVGTIAHGPNGSTLELKAIGVYYPHNLREAKEVKATYQFYQPNGELLSAHPLKEYGMDPRQADCRREKGNAAYHPSCLFLVDRRFEKGARVIGHSLRDSRTSYIHYYSSSTTSFEEPPLLMIECDPIIWHSSPVELRIDCAFPPFEEREMDATTDATVSFPTFDIRYLGTYKTCGGGTTVSNDSVAFFKNPIREGWNVSTYYAFAGIPQYPAAHLSIDVVGADGQLAGIAQPSAMSFAVLSGYLTDAKIPAARFVIKRPTKFLRYVFELPELPGLPPQNRDVTDLLDVAIPYARFRSPLDFERLLRDATQLEIRVTTGSVSSASSVEFPREYEIVTVRELLFEYARTRGPHRVYADGEKDTIIIDTPEGPSPQRQEVERKIKSLF